MSDRSQASGRHHLKHLSDAPPRLQRLLLKLQPYDIIIKYVPGKDVPVADALSRISPSGKTEIQGLDVTIHELTPELSYIQVKSIQEAIKENQVLQLLMQQLMSEWPEHSKQLPVVLRPFWQLKDHLSIEHACITYEGRFYIPQVLREPCMKALHQGHPGMVKMKLRAKTSMYWIGINREIEEHVMQCEPCHVCSNFQQKEPAISMEVPSRSWERVGADLFMQGGRWFLLVADYYSKYPWIFPLMTQTSKDVISAFKLCFPDYGIPEEVICDNRNQFKSREYQEFAATYGFKLTTSSPYYPKGHGFIERQVQTIRNLLNKCDKDGSDPYLALLQLKSTPLDSKTPSSAELLHNRKLRTTLPGIIKPSADSEEVRASLQARQVVTHHDAHAKELPQLLPKQPVWVQNTLTKRWERGIIKSQAETPRSYIVQKPHGEKRRNRSHLRKASIPCLKPKVQVVERVRPHYILIAQKQQDKVPRLVKSVPTPSVNSTANSTPSVNSIQSPKAQSQVINSARSQLPSVNSSQSVNNWQKEKCVKQLVLRKEIQEAVQRSEPKVPKIPPGIGNNNKAIPKVSANKPPDPNTSVQESYTLRRSTRERKPNSRYTQS